jgi:hypothetical protein
LGKRGEKRDAVRVDKTDLFTNLQKTFMRRPMLIFGLPGVLFICVAFGFFALALDIFVKSNYVSTNILVVFSVTFIVGLLLVITGIILRAISARASVFPWSS